MSLKELCRGAIGRRRHVFALIIGLEDGFKFVLAF